MEQTVVSAGSNVPSHVFFGKLLILLLTLLAASFATAAEPGDGELRQVYSEASPPWLQSVGRLDVPGMKYDNGRRVHHRENCSATLVGSPGKRASYIVTAWHCLEFYRDLSKIITFSLDAYDGNDLTMEVQPIIDGGSMDADWAILKLVAQKPQLIQPIGLAPAGSTANNTETLAMAGYSRDTGLGAAGTTLTYHANCRSLVQGKYSTSSNCQAYKGASGGAVVTYSESGEAMFAGVISEGDSEGTSTFVPVSRFRSVLNRYIR